MDATERNAEESCAQTRDVVQNFAGAREWCLIQIAFVDAVKGVSNHFIPVLAASVGSIRLNAKTAELLTLTSLSFNASTIIGMAALALFSN